MPAAVTSARSNLARLVWFRVRGCVIGVFLLLLFVIHGVLLDGLGGTVSAVVAGFSLPLSFGWATHVEASQEEEKQRYQGDRGHDK